MEQADTQGVRRILAAIDASEVSQRAWQQARELALIFKASLSAVYVQARKNPDIVQELKAWTGGDGRFHAVVGKPAATILRLSSDLKPGLVVMGRHQRKGLQRVLLGSVSEEVASKSRVPVLMVHERAHPIRSILAPMAATYYGVTGFAWALTLAEALDSSITLLRASSPNDEDADPGALLEAMLDRLFPAARRRCEIKLVESGKDAAEVIADASQRSDLTVLTYHLKRPFEDRIYGNTVQRVLRKTEAHILCVPLLKPDDPLRRELLGKAFRFPFMA